MTDADKTELASLRDFSSHIGADPLLIQGAGGNSSVKFGEIMWIKASGTQLKDAVAQDIFVPVRWGDIANAVQNDAKLADMPQEFQLDGELRPSIETCLHAVLPNPVVIHVHCVDTIALAMRPECCCIVSGQARRFQLGVYSLFQTGCISGGRGCWC